MDESIDGLLDVWINQLMPRWMDKSIDVRLDR